MSDDGVILIMGVGGCGSGFIWGLLGDCGFDTKGINEWMRHSGIRQAHRDGTAGSFEYPEVIKHLGGFLADLNYHIDRNKWKVRHIFFAAASYDYQIDAYVRRRRRTLPLFNEEQRREGAKEDYPRALGRGLIQLIERDHPFTIIRCPRSLQDPKYCYEKLKVVLGDMSYDEFKRIHGARIIPEEMEKWQE